MHRVITRFRDRHGQVITEKGPWHPHRDEAERWAGILQDRGYQTEVESQGSSGVGNHDLAQALSSMA